MEKWKFAQIDYHIFRFVVVQHLDVENFTVDKLR